MPFAVAWGLRNWPGALQLVSSPQSTRGFRSWEFRIFVGQSHNYLIAAILVDPALIVYTISSYPQVICLKPCFVGNIRHQVQTGLVLATVVYVIDWRSP